MHIWPRNQAVSSSNIGSVFMQRFRLFLGQCVPQEVSELAVMRYTVNIFYVIFAILIIHYFVTMLDHLDGGGGVRKSACKQYKFCIY